jgi:hypothetical protein
MGRPSETADYHHPVVCPPVPRASQECCGCGGGDLILGQILNNELRGEEGYWNFVRIAI